MPWRSKYKKLSRKKRVEVRRFDNDGGEEARFWGDFYRSENTPYPSTICTNFSKKEIRIFKNAFRRTTEQDQEDEMRRYKKNMKRNNRRKRGRFNRNAASYAASAVSGGLIALTAPYMRNAIHRFTRVATLTPLVFPVTGSAGFGQYTFSLDAVPNFTEFTAMFLQYMIERVEITFTPVNQQLNTGAVATGTKVPFLYTTFDPLCTEPVQTVEQIEQFPNLLKTPATAIHKRMLSPSPLSLVYISSTQTGFVPGKAQWLGINQPNVPHVGLRYVASVGTTTAAYSMDVSVKYYLAFKNSY